MSYELNLLLSMVELEMRQGSAVDHSKDAARRAGVVRQAFKAKRAFQLEALKRAPIRKGGLAVELFAGKGTSPVAALKGLRHFAIEIKQSLASAYKRRNPQAKVLATSWSKALKAHHDRIKKADVCVLDVDPFGHPFAALKSFLSINKPTKPMLTLVTYGYLFEQLTSKKGEFTRETAWSRLQAQVRKAARGAGCSVQALGWSVPERVGVRTTSKVVYGAFSIKALSNKSSHLPKLASGSTPMRDHSKVDKADCEWDWIDLLI